MRAFILVLILPLSAFAADLPFCEDRFLNKTEKFGESDAPHCESYKNSKQLVLENYPDGTRHLNCVHWFKLPNELQSEFKKIEPEITARAARTKAFFNELKSEYQSAVDRSQNEFLSLRLEELQLSFRPCPAKQAIQAQLMLISNTIVLCEQLLLLPREAMLTHLSHEIAHVTDPCLYTITAELTFPNYETREKFENCFGKAEGAALAGSFSEARERGQENFAVGRKFAPNSTGKATYEKMKSCGMVKESSAPKPGSQIKNHPFGDIVQCTYREKDLTAWNYEPKSDEITSFDTSPLRTARSPNRACTVEGKEEYAEAVGSLMSARYLQKHPPRQGYEKSIMAMKDFMTCALNNQSTFHVAANKAMLMALQYEPFQKIAGCRLKANPNVCGRAGGASGTGAGADSTISK